MTALSRATAQSRRGRETLGASGFQNGGTRAGLDSGSPLYCGFSTDGIARRSNISQEYGD